MFFLRWPYGENKPYCMEADCTLTEFNASMVGPL
jgi:hypothetical protein